MEDLAASLTKFPRQDSIKIRIEPIADEMVSLHNTKTKSDTPSPINPKHIARRTIKHTERRTLRLLSRALMQSSKQDNDQGHEKAYTHQQCRTPAETHHDNA